MKKILLLNLILIIGLAVSAQATLFTPDTDNHLKLDGSNPFSDAVNESIEFFPTLHNRASLKVGYISDSDPITSLWSESGKSGTWDAIDSSRMLSPANAVDELAFTDVARLSTSGESDFLTGRSSLDSGINFPAMPRLSAASEVPEPATMFLLGAGLLLVAGFLRKRAVNNNSEKEME